MGRDNIQRLNHRAAVPREEGVKEEVRSGPTQAVTRLPSGPALITKALGIRPDRNEQGGPAQVQVTCFRWCPRGHPTHGRRMAADPGEGFQQRSGCWVWAEVDRRCVTSHKEKMEAKTGGHNEEGKQASGTPRCRSATRLKCWEPAAALFCMITCLIYFASQKLWPMTEPIYGDPRVSARQSEGGLR